MDKIKFDQIVSNQTEITDHKKIVKYYKKIIKLCGFINLKDYYDLEYDLKPITEYGEVRLCIDDVTYIEYINIKEPYQYNHITKVSYGLSVNKYLIKNIGDGCHKVFEISQ